MIFVTVGNPYQPFDRLIRYVDELIMAGQIDDDVLIQRGYSKYVPNSCQYVDFLDILEYQNKIKKADIVITHGGTGSIINSLRSGKKPIVVPRRIEYNEHCNDHQIQLVKELESQGKIFAVYELGTLLDIINKVKYEGCSYKFKLSKNRLHKLIEKYISQLAYNE